MADGNTPNRAAILLHVLGNPDPGRLRDAWVEKGDDGEPTIAIYTRNGGGNRECYCDDYASQPDFVAGTCTGCVGDKFEALDGCFRAEDDDFDSTYRTYYFRVPAEYRDMLAEVATDPVDMSARWLAAIDAIGKPKD